MSTIRFNHIALILIIALSAGCGKMKGIGAKNAETPSKEVRWAWRKNFTETELKNIALAWNGSRLAFTATAGQGWKVTGDIIVGCRDNSRAIRDWLAGGTVSRISLDGDGKRLLAEKADGGLLYLDEMAIGKEPVPVPGSFPCALFSPKGDYILVREEKAGEKAKLSSLSTAGKLLWACPLEPTKQGPVLVPFLEKEKQVLYVSKDNDLVLSDGPSLLWKEKLKAAPVALASSFIQGDVLALATGGDKGEVLFYNEKGKLTGTASFPGGAVSLSCSTHGYSCAALSNGGGKQSLSLFNPDGSVVWRYTVDGEASSPSSVFVAEQGNAVVAGFEEKGAWYIRAWDAKGNGLWSAPVEGGLVGFRVSWSGKKIAALTKDGRAVFFDTTVKQ